MEFMVDNANQTHTEIKNLESNSYLYDPGLLRTSVCKSSITWLDGEKGELRYRGYHIDKLAYKHNFQEIMYLLLNGELPNSQELEKFKEGLLEAYKIPDEFAKSFALIPRTSHPMASLMSLLVNISCHIEHNNSNTKQETTRMQTALHILSIMPSLAIACLKKHLAQELSMNRETAISSHTIAEELLGLTVANDHVFIRAIDKILILHADHELNASTFTMRVAASTHSNLYACLQAAIAALWGPAHGGANEACLKMLSEIGSIDRIPHYIDRVKDPNDSYKLMGFGHRVYKNYDPRAKMMQQICHEVMKASGNNSELFEVAMKLEEIALNDEYFIERKLYPNVDFYSGITLKALGIPSEMFTVIFALARTTGWISHWLEMYDRGPFKIFRPRQFYDGITSRDLV